MGGKGRCLHATQLSQPLAFSATYRCSEHDRAGLISLRWQRWSRYVLAHGSLPVPMSTCPGFRGLLIELLRTGIRGPGTWDANVLLAWGAVARHPVLNVHLKPTSGSCRFRTSLVVLRHTRGAEQPILRMIFLLLVFRRQVWLQIYPLLEPRSAVQHTTAHAVPPNFAAASSCNLGIFHGFIAREHNCKLAPPPGQAKTMDMLITNTRSGWVVQP